MTSTTDRIVEHLSRAFAALEGIGGDARAAKQLLELLGWDLPPGVVDIGLAQLDVSAVIDRLDELTDLRAGPASSELDLAAGVADLVAALAQAFSELDDLVAAFQASAPYLDATGVADQFFGRLLDVLLIGAAGMAAPASVAVGVLLGVFELTEMPADPTIFQVEHVRQTVRWDRLSTMFTDPGALLREVYGWGTAGFDGNALVTNLGGALEFLATSSRLRSLPRAVEEQFVGRSVPEADTSPAAQVFVSLDQGLGPSAFDVGISLYALRPSAPGATDGGLGLSPYAFGTAATSFDLADRLSLVISASERLQGGLALLLRPGHDPEILVDLLGQSTAGSADSAFTLTLRFAAAAGERTTLLSAPAITIDAAAIGAGVGLEVGSDLDPSLFARIEDGRIRLVSDGADGFLSSVLPTDGITLALDLDISWSQRNGLRIHGGAGLRTTLTLHQQIGPLLLETLGLALVAGAEGVVADATVSGAVGIGPVTATVDSVGATVALQFARGNLGPVDLGARFHPPSGIGLSVDAHGVLTGGGFLTHDPATGNYAGVMQLSLHDQITLSAYGLIATRLPDGSRGYSLLVFITAEGFRPVPLGFGFMLQAIGGMVGVHRTFDADVIAAGLKTDSLRTLLFPRDPVANAPALIQALATAFPARQGNYLLGLLARITWFTPTLVQLDLALILELGTRTRLLALGRVSALLPSRDNDLIRLNLDALGVLDFDASTLAMDAVLVDSRLAHQFPITGSAALRARWSEGSGPNFVLAIGGLNPRFAPPDGFPALERVTIALCSGNNPRLICDAYLAITANTVQFGSRVSLYAEAVGFSVSGDLGFDALVTIVPPHFIVDFHAAVQLKRGSHNLFKVTLDGTLEGPLPLRLTARATFEILWFSFSVHFDFSLAAGDGAQAVPPAVDVAAELMTVLADPASWSTRRSPLLAHGVALRSLPADAGLVLDPLGQLLVQQQVVPLNTRRDVDTYGGIAVQGARRFNVAASLNGTAGTSVTAAFAPARYFVMSDDDKLAAPSFESMDAGLLLSDDTVTFDADTIVAAPLRYEAVTLNPPAAASSVAAAPGAAATAPESARYTLPVTAFTQQRPSGAAARVPLRRAGRARFRQTTVAPAATLAATRWRLVRTSDGAIAPDDPNLTTWAEYRAAVDTLNRDGASWLMVPAHELSA